MSIIPPGLALDTPFYLSGPLPCPYIPTQVERKLFTYLDGADKAAAASVNAALCRAGFRRSHDVVYRPACNACNACVPVRIAVPQFVVSGSLRRIEKRNRDLIWSCAPARATEEMYALFYAYQAARHSDSDMARMSMDEFAAMLEEGKADTHVYLLRDACGKLLGCMIADHVGDGLSAVYSFFDPEQPRRGLGSALILGLIAETKRQGRLFVYLGYWVEQSRKMAYKTRFQPLQILGANGWEPMRIEGKDGKA